jgi:hypothetical protein
VVSHPVGSRVVLALLACATAGACNSILGNDPRDLYVAADGSADDGALSPDHGGGDVGTSDGSVAPTTDAGSDGDGGAAAGQEGGPDADMGDAISEASVVDAAPTCTAFPAGQSFVCMIPGVGPETVAVPSQYCSYSGGVRSTPAQCQCEESYTCDCVTAAGAFACGGNPITCSDTNDELTFSCN